MICQSQLLTYLLDSRLDLLYVSRRVVALSYNDMQMCLVLRSRLLYPRFEDVFCFFHELTVQVYCVSSDTSLGVVFTEDEFGCLLVVSFGRGFVFLAFFREGVRF